MHISCLQVCNVIYIYYFHKKNHKENFVQWKIYGKLETENDAITAKHCRVHRTLFTFNIKMKGNLQYT